MAILLFHKFKLGIIINIKKKFLLIIYTNNFSIFVYFNVSIIPVREDNITL